MVGVWGKELVGRGERVESDGVGLHGSCVEKFTVWGRGGAA